MQQYAAICRAVYCIPYQRYTVKDIFCTIPHFSKYTCNIPYIYTRYTFHIPRPYKLGYMPNRCLGNRIKYTSVAYSSLQQISQIYYSAPHLRGGIHMEIHKGLRASERATNAINTDYSGRHPPPMHMEPKPAHTAWPSPRCIGEYTYTKGCTSNSYEVPHEFNMLISRSGTKYSSQQFEFSGEGGTSVGNSFENH
jgi:hypothetical protein